MTASQIIVISLIIGFIVFCIVMNNSVKRDEQEKRFRDGKVVKAKDVRRILKEKDKKEEPQ